VREHHRKETKAAKIKSKKKKHDVLNVPNKCPFKEDILNEVAKQRTALEELQTQKRAEAQAMKQQKKKSSTTNADSTTATVKRVANLSEFVDSAAKRQKAFNDEQSFQLAGAVSSDVFKSTQKGSGGHGLKTYASEVRKVIEQADVIFEVRVRQRRRYTNNRCWMHVTRLAHATLKSSRLLLPRASGLCLC
jgi:hypothetical protein